MNRRDLLAMLGATAALSPRRARAEEKRLLGVLFPFAPDSAEPSMAAVRSGLKDGGFVEGANLTIATRYANGDDARLAPLAAELAALKPDVIIAFLNAAINAVRSTAPTVPLVGQFALDPVALGFFKSYARPGGMVTGLTLNVGADFQLGKRVEILKDLVPGLRRVGYIMSPDDPAAPTAESAARAASDRLGLEIVMLPVRTMADLEAAFAAGIGVGGILAFPGVSPLLLVSQRKKLVDLALEAKIPLITINSSVTRMGALVSYGPDLSAVGHRLGEYAAKILAGTKPGDLPVEMPEKLALVINLKTAKALGLTIPQSILARADELIE